MIPNLDMATMTPDDAKVVRRCLGQRHKDQKDLARNLLGLYPPPPGDETAAERKERELDERRMAYDVGVQAQEQHQNDKKNGDKRRIRELTRRSILVLYGASLWNQVKRDAKPKKKKSKKKKSKSKRKKSEREQ